MFLPIHKRYEIIFLSNHPKGPQLHHADVAKAVHCSIYTVKYWLDRWKQSKDLASKKLAADSSTHLLCYLGWPCNCLVWMQNIMLYRLVTHSKGVVNQKLGVSAGKPYKIHDFDGNPCRHSLENLSWPSKLHRSTQNFLLYRLITDSKGLWPKIGGLTRRTI